MPKWPIGGVCSLHTNFERRSHFAETIHHISLLSISRGACQFLRHISFEVHDCRKCRFKWDRVLLPAKIPTQSKFTAGFCFASILLSHFKGNLTNINVILKPTDHQP